MILSLTQNTPSGKLSQLLTSSMLSSGRGARCMASVLRLFLCYLVYVLLMGSLLILLPLSCGTRVESPKWLFIDSFARFSKAGGNGIMKPNLW